MNFLRIYRSSSIGRIADWTSLGQLAFGLAGFFGGSALLSWAFSTIEPIMQYGWGAVMLLGIAIACVVVLALSVAAFAFRAFFPVKAQLQKRSSLLTDEAASNGVQISQFISEFDALKGIIKLHSEDFNERFGFVSMKVEQSIERIGEIEQLLRPAKTRTLLESLGKKLSPESNRFDSVANALDILAERLNSFDLSIREKIDVIEKKIERLNEDTYSTFKKIQRTIHHERVLESYISLTQSIDAIASKLEDPLGKPELYGDWNIWASDYSQFRILVSNLERFIAANTDINLDLFKTPTEKYNSQNWSYNFRDMTDDQKLDYKTYKIVYENFISSREETHSKLYNATFFNM